MCKKSPCPIPTGVLYVSMKEFWNERYSSEEYVYGQEPNEFLKKTLPNLKPGKILFPCEGEGRNAVFAARHGWTAVGVDWSEEGKKKAEKLAETFGTRIEYHLGDVNHLDFSPGSFAVIALVFAHFPPGQRRAIHRRLVDLLAPGGYVVLEGFSRDHAPLQIRNPRVGGPKDPAMLFSIEDIREDFQGLEVEICEQMETELKEGIFHEGLSSVVRFVAKKF